MQSMKLDVDYVRSQFNQIHDNPDFVFCSNAGGSYVANQVNQILNHYNHHTRVQPYERYTTSTQAGEAMDKAIHGWSEALNISSNELTIGPSTSMNTYVMAQAIGANLNPGDEIIVTNQDHEANSGVWRRKAEEKQVTLKEWRVQPDTGLLDPEDLYQLLSEKTQWVFFTHCSNIVGSSNPVKKITSEVKNYNSDIKVFVDAVAYAPHRICNLKDLGVDGYAFSLYKVFGPHQSLMYINSEILQSLAPQCHYFNTEYQNKLFNPAGPQHAQVASCAGVLNYFDELHKHHFRETHDGKSMTDRLADIGHLIHDYENHLTQPILDFLDNHKNVRLIGKSHINDGDRAPTIAFKPLHNSSLEISSRIQHHDIGCESSNFYAYRLISDLGIDPEDGVVRVSLVHYSTPEEVEKIIHAMDASL